MQLELPVATRSNLWQTLKSATWLEWQTRGNWTNPILFALFLLARPISASLVLVFMYRIVIAAGGASNPNLLGFLIVGSSAWSFVEQVLAGIPQAVVADREEYAMLKYVYITPQNFIVFLLGRAIPRIVFGGISFIVTLAFGIAFLGIPVDVRRIDYPLLLIALPLGMISIMLLSILFAGLCLVFKRGAYQMPQAVAGALYLVTGAIFPVAVLPQWLQVIALGVPLTYWLQLMRLALLGPSVAHSFPFASAWQSLVGLVLTTILTTVYSLLIFRVSDHYARERGQIDRTTGF